MATMPGRAGVGMTLADVADAAGVGESTVSRVLRNQGAVSPKTRARVMAAVAALGYVPNMIAGALASAGSPLVGVIVPSFSNVVFSDVLHGVGAALEGTGRQAVVGVTDYDFAREEALIGSMLSWRPVAVLLAGLEHSERSRAMLAGSGARVAEMLDIDAGGIDLVVGFSTREVGRTSAAHLLARDYRRIGYVGHDLTRDSRAAKRLAGFEEALAEAGLALKAREVIAAPSSIENGRDGLERLLSRQPRLDAVYFSNDDMALGGYFFCLSRGIPIPGRLALFGYNGLDMARLAPQPISTIRTPRVLIGETAARLALSDAPPQTLDVGFELVEGATT
jgi:LacI family transcriptional regulator, gluconate utilization system Gnt-I transcriptional repressor